VHGVVLLKRATAGVAYTEQKEVLKREGNEENILNQNSNGFVSFCVIHNSST
jgi:hypothetical protein